MDRNLICHGFAANITVYEEISSQMFDDVATDFNAFLTQSPFCADQLRFAVGYSPPHSSVAPNMFMLKTNAYAW